MKERHYNKIWILPLLLPVMVLLSVVVWATEPTGSITVNLTSANHNNSAVSGADIALYQVAERIGGKYVTVKDYAFSGIEPNSLNAVQNQLAAAKSVTSFIDNNNLIGVKCTTDSLGKSEFFNLSEGLYLLRVMDTGDTGITTVSEPFWVSIPMWNSDATQCIYDVIARPKCNTYEPDEPAIPPDKNLPQTGQNLTLILTFLAIGLLLIFAGSIRLHKGRKGREDEGR